MLAITLFVEFVLVVLPRAFVHCSFLQILKTSLSECSVQLTRTAKLDSVNLVHEHKLLITQLSGRGPSYRSVAYRQVSGLSSRTPS